MSRADLDWDTLVRHSQELLLLAAAHRIDLFRALEKGAKSPSTLATELSVDFRAVQIVLTALEALKLCEKAHGAYQLTPAAQTLFHAPDHPDSIQALLPHQFNLIQAFLRLPQVIRSGRSIGMLSEPEPLAHFLDALNSRPAYLVQEAVDELLGLVESPRRVLDLGGGPGRYSKAFAQQGLQVTLLDRPEVIEYGREAFGLSDVKGLKLVKGDFLQEVPTGPYDIIFLGHICHLYGPETNRRLFQRTAQALRPGGILGVLDFIQGRSSKAPLFAVIMLLHTSEGDIWSEEQYRTWIGEARLSDVQFHDMGDGESQLCTARR